jgi:UDP-N-acetylmuramoyl-tripeptide--D-alanyl-D-alanine ligase
MTGKEPLWTIAELERALAGEAREVIGQCAGSLGPVVTDSRRISRGCIFIAIRGARFDGHDFVAGASAAGAGAVVVEHRVEGCSCPQIVVRDTLDAYGAIARFWRRRFSSPVICVVGSNGKTPTTQMIASILRAACGEAHALATERNFNNQIGVPMMLLKMRETTQYSVIEAGMNHPGEMSRLASFIRPTVVVVTNAQREHQEFLDGVEASARENGLAIVSLPDNGVAVLPQTDGCAQIWADLARARGCRTLWYAHGGESEVTVRRSAGGLTLSLADGRTAQIEFSLPGEHVAHDAAAAAAASFAAGVPLDAVVRGLAQFRPVKGRGVHHRLSSGAVVVDEAYNANPDSMRAAIEVLGAMQGPRILIAGDMAEVGDASEAAHAEIGAFAREKGIEEFWCAGEQMKAAAAAFGPAARHFETTQALQEAAIDAAKRPVSMLLKASNCMGFAKIVDALLQGA